MSAAIDWGMLEAQYLGDEQYNQDIKKMLTTEKDVCIFFDLTYNISQLYSKIPKHDKKKRKNTIYKSKLTKLVPKLFQCISKICRNHTWQ